MQRPGAGRLPGRGVRSAADLARVLRLCDACGVDQTSSHTARGGEFNRGIRDIWRVLVACWPFVRPYGLKLAAYFSTLLTLFAIGAVSGIMGADIFTNKILVGHKLQPLQAFVLFLDDSYVANPPGEGREAEEDEIAADEAEEPAVRDALTAEQRKVVRNRFLLWSILGGIMLLVGIATMPLWGMWIWHQVNRDLRVRMLENAEHLSLGYHADSRAGDAMYRVYQDSMMITAALGRLILEPLEMLWAIVTGLAVVAFFDLWLALALIVAMIPIVLLGRLFTPAMRERSRKARIATSDLTSRLQESFSALKVVKANRAEADILKRFSDDSQEALEAAYRLRVDLAWRTFAVIVIGVAALLIAEYFMASWVVIERETWLGAAAVAIVGYTVWNYGAISVARESFAGTSISIGRIVRNWWIAQDLLVGLDRALHLLSLEPEVADKANPEAFPKVMEDVRFDDVVFGYGEGEPVLRGASLTARAGTITAIVGGTGAGKSTLMSLLLRLFDPRSGRVRINGVDLRDYAIADIRSNVAIALQKNVLFATTVHENIAYPESKVPREAVLAAARIACADEFVGELEQGYDTELGERGGKLSTGQRQRLSIARAVLRDTGILILDEPTAALDAETEQRVLRNLAQWGAGRVVFLITHRLSTIRNADQIAFIENGVVEELGTHDDLMAAAGRYKAFVEAETEGAAHD